MSDNEETTEDKDVVELETFTRGTDLAKGFIQATWNKDVAHLDEVTWQCIVVAENQEHLEATIQSARMELSRIRKQIRQRFPDKKMKTFVMSYQEELTLFHTPKPMLATVTMVRKIKRAKNFAVVKGLRSRMENMINDKDFEGLFE